ncbi:MAG: NUDIX domain-containing protein [Candidatus Dormibacteria bacterium]
MAEPQPLSEAEFRAIYAKVPRLTVEIILADERGVLLTRRAIEPCRGLWHLPGGTVRFGEPLMEAVRRVAADELGISVSAARMVGAIEYPSHYLNGLDCPVGLAHLVTAHGGTLRLGPSASESGWFTRLPRDMHEEQWRFLERLGLAEAPAGNP